MIKAVIVDFDDTLCLTEEACYLQENEALQKMGRARMDRAFYRTTWGQPLFEAIKVRSPGVDVDEFRKVLLDTHAKWIADGKIDVVPPENLQVLDSIIHREGKAVFILTSRSYDEAKHLMEPDHALAERIKAFYYKDVMVFHKPDPRAFSHLLEDHDLQPEECVYVGDAISDAQAAKGAGLHFVASLEAGIRTRDDFANEQVDAFIDRFSDLPKALATMESTVVS